MSFRRFLHIDLPQGQSCFLWGARKTGKSTYLKTAFPDAIYIDLLKADVYQHYLRNPEKLRHELISIDHDTTIILDEVQKVPALLDEVHGLIEEKKNLRFIMCGSSSRRLKTSGANLLGGRAWKYMFLPLCYPEYQTLDWQRIFNHGLIPGHYLSALPERSLAAYLYDYILNEVHMEANLRKRDTFARFMDVLGFYQGEMIRFSNIGRECGVDSKTVRTYFEILEDMYLGYFLYPFQVKMKRQTIQDTPKFYLFDTGIASYLKKYHFQEMVGPEAGKAFEHFLFLELKAYLLLNNKRDSLTYWRTKEGYEIDFIVQKNAIEVKLTSRIEDKHLKNLVIFGRECPYQLHMVSCELTKRIVEKEGLQITIWPIEEFLKSLWADQIIT